MRYTVPDDEQEEILRSCAVIAALPTCRVCGCNVVQACAGGCGWAAPNLCTSCGGREDQARAVHGQAVYAGRHGRA